jgi:predicted butyrate kinase (DUF1464 family)
MKAIGVDPGTKSYDIFGLDRDNICIDTSIATDRVMKQPHLLIDILESQNPFDILVAPSGFGLPIKKVQNLTNRDIFELTLRKEHEQATIGLQEVLRQIQKKQWNAYVIPGVKHLTSIPQYRKINRIDMGTADKVCVAVVGIRDMMEQHKIECNKVNYILIEIGSGFSAILGIEKGKIIDGIGGSNLMGLQACGALDGELAYLLGQISKQTIYQGGVNSIIGYNDIGIEEMMLLAQRDSRTQQALDAFIENITKGVYAIWSSFPSSQQPMEILISGRLAHEQAFEHRLVERLHEIASVRLMKSYANIAKKAAQGAAFIAEGISGGKFTPIIENLGLKQASGHILDDIFFPLDGIDLYK